MILWHSPRSQPKNLSLQILKNILTFFLIKKLFQRPRPLSIDRTLTNTSSLFTYFVVKLDRFRNKKSLKLFFDYFLTFFILQPKISDLPTMTNLDPYRSNRHETSPEYVLRHSAPIWWGFGAVWYHLPYKSSQPMILSLQFPGTKPLKKEYYNSLIIAI